MIYLKYWGGMKDLTGKAGEEITAGTMADVLHHIETAYGKPGLKEAKRMLITVDSTNIQLLARYKTPLADGATVMFLPLSGGG